MSVPSEQRVWAPWGAHRRALGRVIFAIPFAGARATPAIPEIRGPAAALRRDSRFRRALACADLLALACSFATIGALGASEASSARALLATSLTLGLCAKLGGLYDRDESLLCKTTLEETPKLLALATACTLVAWLASPEGLGRGAVIVFWATLVALLPLLRSGARRLVCANTPRERCLVVGDERSAQAIRAKLAHSPGVNAELVAHVDLDRIEPFSSETYSDERVQEIRRLAGTLNIQRAIVAPRSAEAEETLNLVRTLGAVGVRVSVVPRLLEVVGSSVEFDELSGLTVMGVRRFQLTRSSAVLKRAFDLLGATLALIVLAPMLAAIAVAIVLDSPGGVLFGQLRVGRHGRPFRIYKFRTMVADAEARKDELRLRNEAKDGLFKIKDDPRVTRVGRLLRRSALDEIPQLLNVLSGQMSLVGPRPLILEEDRNIGGWHRRRLELTPGMTGPWQILGPARVPLAEMVAIDYLYVANWSLWTDVKVLARTVAYVLARRGL